MEQVLALRAAGRAKPGDAVPSVRKLAARLGVNPATVSKAWQKLEAEGVLERRPGLGMVMAAQAEPKRGTKTRRRAALRPLVDAAVVRGRQLGLTEGEMTVLWEKSLADHLGAEHLRSTG